MIREKTGKLSVPDAILMDTKTLVTPSPWTTPLEAWTTHMDYPKLNFAADV